MNTTIARLERNEISARDYRCGSVVAESCPPSLGAGALLEGGRQTYHDHRRGHIICSRPSECDPSPASPRFSSSSALPLSRLLAPLNSQAKSRFSTRSEVRRVGKDW